MKNPRLPLKDYPKNLKPRERLLAQGVEALSDVELLALLLSTGHSEQTALELAQEVLLLSPERSLKSLQGLGISELCQIKGMGTAKATRVAAALEMGRRVSQSSLTDRLTLNRPDLVAAWLMPRFSGLKQEHFIVMFLDAKQRLTGHKVISIGTMTEALVHPRDIFRMALAHQAYALIVAHNHPSGDPQPSAADIQLTRQLIECGKIMQIEIQDHLIVGESEYYSMRAELGLWKTL